MDKKFCIFDMDGTLTDSMHFWKSLGGDYLRSKGIEPDERLLWMVKAMTMTQGAAYFMKTFGIPGPEERIIAEMDAVMEGHYQNDVPLKPGVKEYLLALKARGARLCVATATAEPMARACLRRLGVEQLFDFILSCESIGVSKDRPDIFLLAAQKLGAEPGDCAVVEDAVYAARTAHDAGFYTVGLYEASYAEDFPALRALCDEVYSEWGDISVTFTQRLHAAARPIWEDCLRHPFVTGIRDGTLEKEKFQHFLLQDYLYLFDYARVFALGAAKARAPEHMRLFADNVSQILKVEMSLHRSYMARMGISEEQVLTVRPALKNLSYTNYMLSAAYAGGAADIAAVILACSWSYAEIGGTLAQIPGAKDHPFYGEWIESYASEDYAAVNRTLIDLTDRLSQGLPEGDLQRLEDIFVACSRFELGFWDMAWNLEA